MARRYYKDADGNKIPSVTTILGMIDKPALVQWSANCAIDYVIDSLNDDWNQYQDKMNILELLESARKKWRGVSMKARDIGSEVHDYIEMYLKHGRQPSKPSDEALSAFIAFLEWEREHDVRVIETEHVVYGDGYAGTTDLIAICDGIKFIIDFKTSKRIYREMALQTAAYRCACGDDIQGNGVLRLDKETGEPEWKDFSAGYEHDIASFIALKDWYNIEYGGSK